MARKIRVLVVDDSMLFRSVLVDKLSKNPNIEVVGYAVDGFDAQRKIVDLNPDVVSMDVEMPKMSGIDLVKKLMPTHPVPVVLVSAINMNVFEALSSGAVDFVRKPDMRMGDSIDSFVQDLTTKIFIASTAKLKTPQTLSKNTKQGVGTVDTNLIKKAFPNNVIIAIGASTGGTEATLEVLEKLPIHTPGIVVVQHMPPGFTEMYANRLNKICAMEVKEAKTGDAVKQGRVLIAPGDYQMTVVKNGNEFTVMCKEGDKVSGHRPSVDVLFNSVATVVGKSAVGVILTGMGQDGANGLLKMRKNGSYTIGQDKESCVVYGMPMVAQNIGAVTTQAPIDKIASVIKSYLNK